MPVQRTGRLMRPNASTASPKYIIAFDTETIPRESGNEHIVHYHDFRLGTAIVGRRRVNDYSREQTYRFASRESFWNLVYSTASSDHTTWVVAHNLLFDLVTAGFADEFEQGRLVIDAPRSKRFRETNDEEDGQCYGLAILESPPTIIGMRHPQNGGRIVAVDTLNWFKCPLSQLGDAIKRPKLRFPDFQEPDSVWFDYCERDCEIVYDTFVNLVHWVKEGNYGMFRYTGAAQSMAAFRHKYSHTPIYIHDNKDVKSLERQSYFGGRVEVFKKGIIDCDVHIVDVNSLFPSVMQNGFFPRKLTEYHFGDDYIELLPDIDYGAAVAEVIVDSREGIYPVRYGDLVIYPVGTFRCTLCGAELQHAKNKGSIKAIRSYAVYELAVLFNHFVTDLYSLRLRYSAEGNELYKQFTKTLLNSLYGKWAQLAEKWKPVHGDCSSVPWYQWGERNPITGETDMYRSIGWQVFKKTEREEKENTFVAISSFITSAARMRMNHLRCIAGAKNTFYLGVDGMIVTNKGIINLEACEELDETRLGKLRRTLSTNQGEIYGCADYRVGGKVVVAGRHSSALQAENDSFSIRRFSGERELFSGAGRDSIVETQTTWRRGQTYRKGTIGSGGWINAIVLDQLDDSERYEASSATLDRPENSSITTTNVDNSPPSQASAD